MAKNKRSESGQLLHNIKRSLVFAYRTDRKLMIATIILTFFAGILPIAVSYAFKLLIDETIRVQQTTGIITAALLSYFAFNYLLELLDDLQSSINYQYLNRIYKFKLENRLTYEFTEKISSLDMPHFEDSETQNLIRKANDNFLWRIPQFTQQIFYFFHSFVTVAGSFVVLISFGFWFPAIMVLSTVPRFFLKNKYNKITWSLYSSHIPEGKDLWYLKSVLTDYRDIKEMRVFQATGELLRRFKKLQEFLFQSMKKVQWDYFRSFYFPLAAELATLVALAYLKLPDAAKGIMTVGSFTFFIQNLSRISRNASELGQYMADLYDHNLYIGYYFEVMDLPKIVNEKEPGHVFSEVKPPSIEFQNVSFNYHDGPKVLENISFKLEPGEHLAIVGANGAGKTTLIKLLLRFYDPAKGAILINDYDLRDLRLNNWYKFIGILFQDFTRFWLTVKDNIMLGNPKILDEEKMHTAAKKSGANEFIDKLPKKYDQRLGRMFEKSTELSSGQWQKLALARAFYEEAPILILDEPTSAIDAEAEAQIFENLYKLYKNKTLVLISHRFSTVRNAHKIIVLKNGKIAEEGNHGSLMAKDGIYAEMFRKQAKGYIE